MKKERNNSLLCKLKMFKSPKHENNDTTHVMFTGGTDTSTADIVIHNLGMIAFILAKC
jgi:hypothetical protein